MSDPTDVPTPDDRPAARRLLRLQCPCGRLITAGSEDEMVKEANAHLAAEHPHLVGEYGREQILFLAY